MTARSPSVQLRVVGDHSESPSVDEISRSLRAGRCPDDDDFDRFLPESLRVVSRQHWTPVDVGLRVAEWLNDAGVRSCLDIGSGAGKFCVVAALASHCEFTGIEQRVRLVTAARGLARRFNLQDRVRFVHATAGRSRIPPAEAYYLFNPFLENLFHDDEVLGLDVELSEQRFQRDVRAMETMFQRAPVGTYVIKYNGFGGRMPSSYDEVRVDRELRCVLRMWRKTSLSD